MGAMYITSWSLDWWFNESHFGLPPRSMHRMSGWVDSFCKPWCRFTFTAPIVALTLSVSLYREREREGGIEREGEEEGKGEGKGRERGERGRALRTQLLRWICYLHRTKKFQSPTTSQRWLRRAGLDWTNGRRNWRPWTTKPRSSKSNLAGLIVLNLAVWGSGILAKFKITGKLGCLCGVCLEELRRYFPM